MKRTILITFATVVATSCVAPPRSYGVTKEVLVVLSARPLWGSPGFTSCGWLTSGDLPVVGDWAGTHKATIGVFRPSTGQWFLRNSNTPGNPDIPPFAYGALGDIPVIGDWTGSGKTTIGVFRPSTGQWFLRNSNTPGNPDIPPFAYGALGDIPVVGDWTGSGKTTIGVFRPSTGQWFLRNSNTPGNPDIPPFAYGALGDTPVAGDWTGIGKTTIGVFRNSTTQWFLRNSNTPGNPDINPFSYGARPDPLPPRRSASEWQTIFDQQVTPYFATESTNNLIWKFKVVANPQPGSQGWWPAPQCSANSGGNFGPSSFVGLAAQMDLSAALSQGLITTVDILSIHNFIVIDNRQTDQGQSDGQPDIYQVPIGSISLPFNVWPSAVGEGSSDASGIGVIRHELGNQLGLPELYSGPCRLVEPGGIPATDDCYGAWDMAAFNANGFGVYERMLAGWLLPNQINFEQQSWSGTVSISPLEQPDGDALALILSTQPVLGPGDAQPPSPGPPTWQGYIVECRRQIGDDVGLPSGGVLVTYFNSHRGHDDPALVVRTVPQEQWWDAILKPGQKYANSSLGVRVTYTGDARNGSCEISVNR